MRFLILSDIHANWEALEAVLRDAARQYEAVLCLGDIVGYGPNPNEVTAWVRENADVVIRGNHDKACAGIDGIGSFNPIAQASSQWTRAELHARHAEWLAQLPRGPLQVESFDLVHGAPDDEDRYIFHVHDAEAGFRHAGAALTFFGHNHVQGGFIREDTRPYHVFRLDCLPPALAIDPYRHYLINPGAVGQPRDGDARASYCFYDSGRWTVEYRRVEYDIRTVQEKILDAGLPEELAFRLTTGS